MALALNSSRLHASKDRSNKPKTKRWNPPSRANVNRLILPSDHADNPVTASNHRTGIENSTDSCEPTEEHKRHFKQAGIRTDIRLKDTYLGARWGSDPYIPCQPERTPPISPPHGGLGRPGDVSRHIDVKPQFRQRPGTANRKQAATLHYLIRDLTP
ncbi:hypothetical protein HZS61_001857 [Fusarium oxysporum f. sp. conglutinans]|uniref:Uncharacterized protein n=1 Tax=Fusarium oxysporum f. sp. conglutinans TaxID=100902 RepID=A0A8H6H762_FUSOX|nr:hypothetical protein HZS61_001857 [Fusarium oxysporum f. sp. conglutinans]